MQTNGGQPNEGKALQTDVDGKSYARIPLRTRVVMPDDDLDAVITEYAADAVQPGDLLFFGSPIHHVAIYEGNGMMIEAPRTGQDVKEIPVADFGEPVSAIRRVLGSTSASDTSGVSGRVTSAS